MDVVLLENIRNLGHLGDTVSVKPGFARNYLIPQKFALPANKANLAYFVERKAELQRLSADRLAAAQAKAERLQGLIVKMAARAAEGKLYGSLTVRDVADAITALAGISVGKHEVQMPNGPIRYVGEYEFALELHAEVETFIKIQVEEEK